MEMATCSNLGCEQPGTKQCSACTTTPYCGPICQKADWPRHSLECRGHLLSVGMKHIKNAKKFDDQRNYVESLRCSEMALSKLNLLKDRPLAVVSVIGDAMSYKFNALNFLDRNKEALECATEKYNMWATTNARNPNTVRAALPLIDSLIQNKQFEKAHLIAGTVYEMTMHPTTYDIPDDLQQPLLAYASSYLAHATYKLAQAGCIPSEEKQKAGEEAIALARKAIELHTQLHGADSEETVGDMSTLANVLDYFLDVDDDEAVHLFEQVIAIRSRSQGPQSVNVASNKSNLASVYANRANRAQRDDDPDRALKNWMLALPYYLESYRIYQVINFMDRADHVAQTIKEIRESLVGARAEIAARKNAAARRQTKG